MMPARRPAGTTAGPITYSARMRRGVTATLLSIAVVVAWQAGATPARAEPVQAVSDTYSTFVDKTLVVPAPGVLENDGITSLAGLTIAVYSAPNIGTLKFPGNGSFTYVPVPGYVGTQKFVYSVTETNGAISLASVAIDVIDNRPTANPDDYAVGQGLYLNVKAPGLMANDTDPGGKTLTVASVTQPSHGTVVAAANGAFTYLSDPSFAGIDSFDYDISNGVASTGSNVRIVVSGSGAAGDVGSTKATTAVSGGVPGSASSLPSASAGAAGGSTGGPSSSGGSTTGLDLAATARAKRTAARSWTVVGTVKNVGRAATTGKISVLSRAAKGVTVKSVSAPKGWTCKKAKQTWTCATKKVLAPAAKVVLTYTVKTTKGAKRTLRLTATTVGDTVARNNTVLVKVPAKA
jgi:hypothetical protein